MIKLSINTNEFLDSFTPEISKYIDKDNKTKIDLFVLKINANDFDYSSLVNRSLEPLASFSLSRKTNKKLKKSPMALSKKAREKFNSYVKTNDGELGEFLLYCFLESHLKAPKILTKLELKTSTSMPVHGSDGVHFLKLENGDYQLIFGESKTINDIGKALAEAFKSIYEFKNEINSKGKEKSGLPYEKSLIASHLENETFSEEEKDFIKKIIYPKEENDFEVDDAFGIFIGFNIEITEKEKRQENAVFRKNIVKKIKESVEKNLPAIKRNIKKYKLTGHNFYIYVLPFSGLKKRKKEILKKLLK